jgi:hypothetical protein
MASFEEELTGLVRNLDESLDVKLTAEEVEKKNRQDFLTEFREVAHNVILPAMRRAAEIKSKAVRIEVKEEHDHVTLNLAVTRDMKKGPDHYWISYNADWQRKRIGVEMRGTNLGFVKTSEISESDVEGMIRDVFKMAGKSGGQ